MKENPTVCAIMLVNGREELVKRAIKSFREQTYFRKRLLVFDTGVDYFDQSFAFLGNEYYCLFGMPQTHPRFTIGFLRNEASKCPEAHYSDILCHWDSDDWSHPRRIEEQVALLQASGKQCVGYKDMLFYDTTPGQFCGAWLYRHATKPLGTSLMYHRSFWEQNPFKDLPKAKGGTGEDVEFLRAGDHLGVTSMPEDGEPRMVASIHGGNTSYYGSDLLGQSTSWRRCPERDKECRRLMAL